MMKTETRKIKPILFSPLMVRAIKRGHKSQTRRVIKFKKKIENFEVGFSPFCDEGEFAVRGVHENGVYGESIFKMPHKKGDILWVRETYSEKDNRVIYRSDVCSKWDLPDGFKWRPSIFMPKRLCRLFLEITRVAIEELNDISHGDCEKEGIEVAFDPDKPNERLYYFYKNKDLRDDTYINNAKTSFYSLWTSINGKESWDENPFVWVYTFKVVKCPKEFK